jgi:adenosine deaminase
MPSEEHFLAMQHFHLSEDDLVELSRNAIRFSFASEQEKRKVVSVLEQFRP